MDLDIERALRLLKRMGSFGLTQVLEIFPVLRHERCTDFSARVKGFQHEVDARWDHWGKEIPELEFPAGWKVKINPPFVGAIVRFRVNGCVSVYLDCNNYLGCEDGPYWEVYDGSEPERFDMADTAGLLAYIGECLGRIGSTNVSDTGSGDD